MTASDHRGEPMFGPTGFRYATLLQSADLEGPCHESPLPRAPCCLPSPPPEPAHRPGTGHPQRVAHTRRGVRLRLDAELRRDAGLPPQAPDPAPRDVPRLLRHLRSGPADAVR